MTQLFNFVLYEPFFNALIFLYKILPDIGIAIIILTIVIKLILFWPSYSAIKSQKLLQETQPKIEELKARYKDNKEELGRQLMRFYKENKVSPFSSCLPLLIQLPILIALYQVFFAGLKTDPATGLLAADQLEHLYGPLKDIFAATPVKPMFLGLIDLAKTKNIILAALAGAFTYWQSRMIAVKKPSPAKVPGAKDETMTAMLNKQMLYLMPLMTVFFGYTFPAGLTLYWIVSTLFTIGQQYYFFRKVKRANLNQPQ